MTVHVHLRYFAAAADAAGTDSETVDLPGGSTIDDLVQHLGHSKGGDLPRVLGLCSFLLDGQAADPGQNLSPGADGAIRVDILPPFAGG